MQDIWNAIVMWYKDYFRSSRFGLLLLLCLIFLLLRKKNKPTRKALFWPTLLLCIVIFCPLTARYIMKLVGQDVYWRVYWLLPIILLAAYAGTELVSALKGRWKQILAAVVCIVLIGVNGSFVFTDRYFGEKDNVYKVPGEVVAVADAIEEHAQLNHIKKRSVSPMEIATYLRIYDASIKQNYGRNMVTGHKAQTQLYCQINADEPDYEVLAEKARKKKCRYVVLRRVAEDEDAMEALNYERIYETENFSVYVDRNYLK